MLIHTYNLVPEKKKDSTTFPVAIFELIFIGAGSIHEIGFKTLFSS